MGSDKFAQLKHENAKLKIMLEAANNTIVEKNNSIALLNDRILKLETENRNLEREKSRQEAISQNVLGMVSSQRDEIIEGIQKTRVDKGARI